MRLLLDTHAFIWLLEGNQKRINRSVQQLIEQSSANNHLYLSAISCWEIAMLESKGRISINQDCQT